MLLTKLSLLNLKANGQIIFTYADENPNGSVENIAGIVNKEGNVLGMMPHPERRMEELLGGADGVDLFASVCEKLCWKIKKLLTEFRF